MKPRSLKYAAYCKAGTYPSKWPWSNNGSRGLPACHRQIHERMAADLRARPLAMVENHHNFAWKEYDGSGKARIVHRKGATPAGKGELGIIPGSMTAPGTSFAEKAMPLR